LVVLLVANGDAFVDNHKHRKRHDWQDREDVQPQQRDCMSRGRRDKLHHRADGLVMAAAVCMMEE
jgi:hypothetical protein